MILIVGNKPLIKGKFNIRKRVTSIGYLQWKSEMVLQIPSLLINLNAAGEIRPLSSARINEKML